MHNVLQMKRADVLFRQSILNSFGGGYAFLLKIVVEFCEYLLTFCGQAL